MFGLWPFNLNQKNEVHWLKKDRGLEFHRAGIDDKYAPAGIAYSQNSFLIPSKSNADSTSFSLEILLQSNEDPWFNFGSILAFKKKDKATSLLIAQWKKSLIIRKHDDSIKSRRHYFEIDLLNIFQEESIQFLTLTSGPGGTKLFLNGVFQKQRKDLFLVTRERSIEGTLILGNSASGREPWAGEIFGIGIYETELSPSKVKQHYQTWLIGESEKLVSEKNIKTLYTFEEGEGVTSENKVNQGNPLLIPEKFTILHKIVLEPPWYNFSLNLSFIFDFTINILGFIPIGIMLTLFLRNISGFRGNKLFYVTVISGGATSFLIEILQIWMPQRYSSLSDLILNIMGLIIGYCLVQLVLFLKRKILTN
jgi:VanZ family protein